MRWQRGLAFLFLIISTITGRAQIIQVSPSFPTRNGMITITYDANEGNRALLGLNPVYAHTGIITTKSNNTTDWKRTQGNWGTADSKVLMTNLGNNRFSISFNIDAFYGATPTDTILYLAFVFRNTDGSLVGRNFDQGDILIPLSRSNFDGGFIRPSSQVITKTVNSTLDLLAGANKNSQMKLWVNNNLLATGSGDTIAYDNYNFLNFGTYNFRFQAVNGTDTVEDRLIAYVNPVILTETLPSGCKEGINYLDDSTVVLSILAPFKNFIYVIGDFNNWQVDTAYLMKKAPDGETWWVKVEHLTPGREYIFQFLVDGQIRVGDPYCEKVSDPNVDIDISETVFPNLIAYPYGKTSGIASVMQTAQKPYNWSITNFQRPDKKKLNIYELLPRDFVNTGSWSRIKDSLNYLANLGINAVQLMPIMNFEGNSSWGYNPNYFCAPNKTYGPEDSLKSFIDLCHSKGMAVILDIPFNNAFGTNPMVMMYWDSLNSRPAKNSPWFNVEATHPFSVGYDFNHTSRYTIDFVNRVNRHWIKEFHIDGYRFDLTKGYTQTNSGTDVGLWGSYDASRIYNLKRMVDSIWIIDPTAYCIFEHLSENQEQKELSDHGIMLWGNMNAEFNQATMGYTTGWDLNWTSYKARGWSQPNLVSYMESHDEERLMYRNLQYGNINGAYNTKNIDTALRRMEMAAMLLFTIPGPKMIWQFGEMGYDISINNGCRVCNKPILWSYLKKPNRLRLYKVYAALLKLRLTYPVFQTNDFSTFLTATIKTVKLNHPDFNVLATANCEVRNATGGLGFQHTGWWFDYFSGDSVLINDINQQFVFRAGEYHLFTDKRLPLPDLTTNITTDIENLCCENTDKVSVFPNPAQDHIVVHFNMESRGLVKLQLMDLKGASVFSASQNMEAGEQNVLLNLGEVIPSGNPSGLYMLRLTYGDQMYTGKIIINH